MNVFQLGEFRLHSGSISRLKIEYDNVSDEDVKTHAFLISKLVGPFATLEGIPTGGLRLARELEQYKTHGSHLIVDDVLTTGRSMEEARKGRPFITVVGAVVFARGKYPSWIRPLFRLDPRLWTI